MNQNSCGDKPLQQAACLGVFFQMQVKNFPTVGFKQMGTCAKNYELRSHTLPESNIAPENGWLEYDPFLLGWPVPNFGGDKLLPIRNPTFLRSAVKTSVSPSTQAVDAATTVAAGADKAAGTLRADIAALILGKTTPTRNTRTTAMAKHFLAGKGPLHLYLRSQKDPSKASRIVAHAMTVFTRPSITVNPLISGLKATFKTRLNFPLIAMSSRKRATAIPSSLFIDDPANHPDLGRGVDPKNWKIHVGLQEEKLGGNRRQSLEQLLLQVNIY